MKKDEKDMNYPLDFKLGKGDREFADANDKGLVVNYSDSAVKLCHWCTAKMTICKVCAYVILQN